MLEGLDKDRHVMCLEMIWSVISSLEKAPGN